jgi:hypothetical protein
VYQQSTYAPDTKYRWLGSVAMNASGDIGMVFTESSSSMYPSVCYTGRKAADALGTMTVTEGTIQTSLNYISYSGTTRHRWGDYSVMSIDPSDNLTFWTTSQYIDAGTPANWPWITKIASFKIANSPTTQTLDPTVITATSGTLNGTVNPNGLATTYYFDWGTTTAYGNTTSALSAGSGNSNVSESATISGLTTGTTYHYRIRASNSEGTSTGNDLTLTPGMIIISTTSVSSVTETTASSGGNISADGGSAVTARGVCWSTSVSPTISDSHTTDGNGTGSFSSSITGLTGNTNYYLRAYATNSNGTAYGYLQNFTTSCGKMTILPITEGFETFASTPACWTEENSNPSWLYITGDGNSNPAAAHSGIRNACLEDATTTDNLNKLISPVLDLSLYNNVILTFYHTQAVWSTDQDQLKIYYRTSSGGGWTLLASYTTSITAWTLETITLPSLGPYYQIAFEGNAKYGYGVCIDDIALKAPGNWVGGTSGTPNAWETASNWGDGLVPTAATNVYITARTYLPVVTSTTAVCNNLVIENSAGIGVSVTDKITVNGKMTLKYP